MEITHVIFDCDGLILDTETIYSKVIGGVCAEYGYEFNWDLKAKQMGKTEPESARIAIDHFNLPITVEEYITKTMISYKKEFPNSELMPGAEKLIRHLHSKGVPIALATASSKVKYDLKTMKYHELFSLFHHHVFASDDPDVHGGKPNPDCFLVALKRFPNPPSTDKVLVFEDAPNGVQAAHAAGMHCVWVPDKNCDTTNDKDKATEILTTLENFQPEKYGLPAY